jgi:hypothetical protein
LFTLKLSKFNEIQKRLQGRDVTIIQARTIIMGFQVKLGLLKNSLDRRDYKYFLNLKHFSTSLMEDHSISDDDIEIFTNHLGNLQDDFRVRFKDLVEHDHTGMDYHTLRREF